jgi:predicted amidophosphoribosyltransferase
MDGAAEKLEPRALYAFGLLLPLIAVIVAFFVKDKRPRCPQCAEVVRPEARICAHCGFEIASTPVGQAPPPPSLST